MKTIFTLILAGLLILTYSFGFAQNVGVGQPSPSEKLDVNGAIRIGSTSGNNAGSIRYVSGSQKFQVNIAGTWYDLATGNLAYINNFSYNASTNVLTIVEGSTTHTVNLTDLQDNTDDQTISLSGNTLSIEDGNNVSLAGYLDNTDDQAISYNTSTNILTLEDGGTVNLTDLQDNTDDQTLSLSGSTLSIESANSVNLTPFLDNTDDQQLSLSGNTLAIESGNSVSLSGYLDNTDDQQITYNSGTNVITLENGGTVDLSDLQDNTDDQAISYNATTNVVTLESGGNINLSDLQDNTDDQAISYNATTNVITLESGGTVNLSDLQDNTDDQNLTLSGNTLSIESGNSVNLGGYLDNTDNQTLSEVYQEGGNTVLMNSGDGSVRFYKSGNEILTLYENTGRVGIGTQTPVAKLNVYGASSATQSTITSTVDNTGLLISSNYVLDNYNPGIFWATPNNNATRPKGGIYMKYESTGSAMILGTSTSYTSGLTNEAIYINSEGNVGIGTNNPVSQLDMDGGSILFDNTDYNGIYFGEKYTDAAAHNSDWGYIRHSTGNGQLEIGSDATVEFFETDARALRVHMNLNTGVVGIGSATPTQLLDVAGDITTSTGYRINNTASSGEYLRGNGTRFVSSAIQAGDIPDGSGYYIQNQTSQQSSSNYNITGNGTIGTTLVLGGSGTILSTTDAGVQTVSFSNDNITGVNNIEINDTGANEGIDWQGGRNISMHTSSSGGYNAFTFHTTTSYPYVFNTGNMGIGTTNPSSKVYISSGTSGDAELTIEADSDNSNENDNPYITFRQDGNLVNAFIGIEGDAGARSSGTISNAFVMGCELTNSPMQFITSDAVRMTIETGGDVGIGTTNPSYDLHVNGRLKTTGINETSDARLKKNVNDIDNALDNVLAMRGVTYQWRKDEYPEMKFEEGTEYGVIAQELEKILPDLVDTDKEGWKSVEYSHMVPLLIEAIKEQQAIIDSQQETIGNQETRITSLEESTKEMEALKTSIKNLEDLYKTSQE